jgi:hypothetical protein
MPIRANFKFKHPESWGNYIRKFEAHIWDIPTIKLIYENEII